MKFIVDMPDEAIPQKQEIVSIDLYFMDGKLCGCTYPFEELETEDDCISRQAAIAVADYADYAGLAIEDVKKVTDEIVKGLKQLSPVTPAQKWIPVSEKLPEENITVIASTDYGVYPETKYTKEYGWEWAYESGADYWRELAGVTAWMPLPLPYKS